MIVLITLFLAVAVFALDLLLPSSIGEWGLYLIPLLIAPRERRVSYPYFLTSLCTVFIVAGFWLFQHDEHSGAALMSRCVGILVLWLNAALLIQRKKDALALYEKEQRLSAELKRVEELIAVSNRHVTLIAQATAALVGVKPFAEEARKLAENVVTAFGVDACVIRTLEGNNLVFLASAGVPEEHIPSSLPENWDGFREIISSRRPVFVPDMRANITTLPFAESLPGEQRFSSCACAPLLAQDRLLGVLCIYSRGGMRGFSDADAEHLQIFANHIAVAIANDRQFKQMKGQKDQLASQMAERKRFEEALRQSEERFRAAIECFPYPFIIYDSRRRLSFVNARCAQLAGREPQSLIGRHDEELFPPEITALYLPALRRAVETRSRQMVECTLPLPGGKLTMLIHYVPLLDELGEIRQILGITCEITERKLAEEALRQSEALFRAISEQSMMGIYIIQNDKFSYVNPRYAEIFGYSQTEMLLLPSAFEVVVNEDRALMQENIRQRLAGRTQGIQYRAHGLRKDGNSITVEIHGIRTELNGKAAVIGTLQDVTERERDESALQRTKEQLQSLSRRLLELQEAERRHIARELHDEIGQALTALKINLQALQRLPDTTSFVPRLVDSINIVDRTLRQVRALSLNLRPSMLDDLGLGAALRWYADQQAQRAGLHIQFLAEPLEERLEPTLETTCFRIAQEALTNIVRHAKAQSIAVELRHEQGLLHLMVRDDGIGFDLQAVQRHLIDGVASMGLLGMEERASLIGGRIELKSGSGEGTEVHAWFPLVYSVPEQAHSADLAVQ